jgi:cation transport regulator ChaC
MAPRYSFAYGSNTDAEDWRAWCARTGHEPAALKAIGTGILPDARIAFDFFGRGRGGGVLNFQPRLGGYVEGVVLEVSEAGWRALDQKEGVPQAYQRRQRHIILPDGQALEAIAYQVIPERQEDFVAPPPAYLNAVRTWIRTGKHALPGDEARARLPVITPEMAMADALFRLALHLRRQGQESEAAEHFAEASRLHPDSWCIFRDAQALEPSGLAGGPAFWERVNALGDKPYYPPPVL